MAEPQEAAKFAATATQVPSPVAVFQGYDSVTGRGLATVLTGETQTTGGTSQVSYRVCTDMATLSEALEVNQSLSVSLGPFGSIDQKLQFIHNLKVTTNSVSIVVYAKHTMGSDTMTDAALKPGIKPPSSLSELRQFFRSYGDSFLGSRVRGGEYYAVYTFYSQTREEQTQLTLDMKAQGIFEGGSVDASLQTKISTFKSSTSTRSAFDQNISGILNPKLPTSDKIIQFAIDFPSIPLDAPAIIGFETSGYEHVPGFGSFQPIARNRDFFVGDSVVGGLTSKLVEVQQLENQITWIKNVYDFYGGYADAKLANVLVQAKADHGTINQLIRSYEEDPTQSFTMPKLPSLDYGSPAMAVPQISLTPSWGGDGGDPFNDVDLRTSIPQHTRVAAVGLRTGGLVDRLSTTYENVGGSWETRHGGGGGEDRGTLQLLPGQFITGVTGRSGGRVDHLKITISDGRTLEGGGGGGGPFSWSVPSGSFVLGFAGRSGANLDRIQVIFGAFRPSIWS
jgi:hypothetical protein